MGGAIGFALFMACILYFGRNVIGNFFTEEPPILSYLTDYLRIVPWGYAFNGILMLTFAILTVSYQPLKAAFLALLHLFGFYIPLAFWFADVAAVKGIFWAYPVSICIVSALGLLFLKTFVFSKKHLKKIRT
jgi:Na+-driven multidrug efflux pump